MTKDELRLIIRRLTDDKNQPYRMSNADIDSFITEAEREAAERALYFRTGSYYDINFVANKADYEIDDLIIFIDRIKVSGQSTRLTKTTRRELDFEISSWETNTDMPTMYFQENRIITLYPIPNVAGKLLIDGSRRPEMEMETPAELQESLAYWCLHRIYGDPDADVFNPNKSLENLALFTKAFGHKRSASFERAWRDGCSYSSMYRNEFS